MKYVLRAVACLLVCSVGLGTARAIPAQQEIVFVSTRDGNAEIYRMHGNGDAQRNLTFNPGADWWPRWSPDGETILFLRSAGGSSQIHVMRANGDAQTNLSQSASSDQDPAWSPDGRSIAFVRSGADGLTIWTMSANGGAQRQLTYGPDAQDLVPAWSPDGAWILFERRTAREGTQLWKMRSNGSAATQLTYPGRGLDSAEDGAWSPDGAWIVFARPTGQMGLWKMRENGDAATQLTWSTKSEGLDREPRWSPDGQWILFVRQMLDAQGLPTENHEVYRMRASGAAEENLTLDPAKDQKASWSDDGKSIVFVTNRDGNDEVYTIDANGDAPRPLSYNAQVDTDPMFGPHLTSPAAPGRRGTICYARTEGGARPLRVISPLGGDARKIADEAQWPMMRYDGLRVAYQISLDMNAPQIEVCGTDGTGRVRPPTGSGFFSRPKWTGSTDQLFFSYAPPNAARDPNWRLGWMNVDGSRFGQAPFSGYDFTPSPDGRLAVFVKGSALFVVGLGAEGAPERQLTAPGAYPMADYTPSWSPDGETIAFLRFVSNDAKFSVCTVPSRGGPARTIAQGIDCWHGVAWSPDMTELLICRKLVAEDNRRWSGELVFVDVATGAQETFGAAGRGVMQFDWR